MARENKTKYAILGMLASGEASGYDLKKKMHESTNHFWYEGDSSIYPALKQLLEDKFVDVHIENKETDKPKKVYIITDQGKSLLEAWLKKEPEPTKDRDELLLKLFFGWNVPSMVSIDHIKEYKLRHEQDLVQYKRYYDRASNAEQTPKMKHHLLTIKAGIISAEAIISWCNEAIETLKN